MKPKTTNSRLPVKFDFYTADLLVELEQVWNIHYPIVKRVGL